MIDRFTLIALFGLLAHPVGAQRRHRDFDPLTFGPASVSISATTASDSGGILQVTFARPPFILTGTFQLVMVRQWSDSVDRVIALTPKALAGETVTIDLPILPSLTGSLEIRGARNVERTTSTYALTSVDRSGVRSMVSASLTTRQLVRLLTVLREACDYADRLAASP